MIGAILAITMATADPVGDAKTPASVPTPAPEKSQVQTAQDNLDQAQQIYTQSCGDRAYGAYDDLCEQLSIQLHQYRVDLDKLERAAKTAKAAPAQPKS